MRDIKFRAWNARSGMTFFDIGELLPEPLPNYYISQYTGLKDKNGVEIYEGDIVKATVSGYFFNAKQTKVSQVVWGIWDDEEYGSCETWVLAELKNYPVYSSECEVIGNIYEHKELLI